MSNYKLKPNYGDSLIALAPSEAIGGPSDGPVSEWQFVKDASDIPTEEEIQTKLTELISTWDTEEYSRNRKLEYDALNQFELMTDDAANSTTTHAAAIAAVKKKWPKDNSGPK